MKKFNFQKSGRTENRNAFRGGSYSLTISVVVLAILVVANIFASSLPTILTKYDISSTKLYSITSNTNSSASGAKTPLIVIGVTVIIFTPPASSGGAGQC